MAGGANPQMTANPFEQASGAQQAALAGTGAGMGYTPSQVQAVNPAKFCKCTKSSKSV